jgi:mitogen-activated protein kinase organizer 1
MTEIHKDIFLRDLRSHTESVNTVKFTGDGNFCMSASNDRTIKLWNPHRDDPLQTGNSLLVKTYSGAHGYPILDVAISQDNSRFVSAGIDK